MWTELLSNMTTLNNRLVRWMRPFCKNGQWPYPQAQIMFRTSGRTTTLKTAQNEDIWIFVSNPWQISPSAKITEKRWQKTVSCGDCHSFKGAVSFEKDERVKLLTQKIQRFGLKFKLHHCFFLLHLWLNYSSAVILNLEPMNLRWFAEGFFGGP